MNKKIVHLCAIFDASVFIYTVTDYIWDLQKLHSFFCALMHSNFTLVISSLKVANVTKKNKDYWFEVNVIHPLVLEKWTKMGPEFRNTTLTGNNVWPVDKQ